MKNKTVIVIGAGASKDFSRKLKSEKEESSINMPTGEELIELMQDGDGGLWEYFLWDFFEMRCRQAYDKIKENGGIEMKDDDFKRILPDIINFSFETVTSGMFSVSGNSVYFDYVQNINGTNHKGPTEIMRGYVIDNLAINDDTLKNNCVKVVFSVLNGLRSKGLFDKKMDSFSEMKEILIKAIECEANSSHYLHLSKLLKHYNPFSIDEFLDSIKNEKINLDIGGEKCPSTADELVYAGKVMIAIFLLQNENDEFANEICWYRHLRHAIITSGKDNTEIKKKLENLEIISFNYDRSLDYYLKTRLKDDLYKAVKEKIKYPYGDLNCGEDFEYGTYRKDKLKNNIALKHELFGRAKKLAENLRTIGEESYSGGVFFGEIANVYFLGFGFHQQNCKMISVEKLQKEKSRIFYTNFGQSQKIERKIDDLLGRKDFGGEIFSSNKGVYDALREDFDLILS